MELFDKVLGYMEQYREVVLAMLLSYEALALRIKTSRSYSIFGLVIEAALKVIGLLKKVKDQIDLKK